MKCVVCSVESGGDHRWGRIRAHDQGWFEMKDGTAYCPEHVPGWVAAWRKSKEERS